MRVDRISTENAQFCVDRCSNHESNDDDERNGRRNDGRQSYDDGRVRKELLIFLQKTNVSPF